MRDRLIPIRQQSRAVLALALASLLCFALIIVRKHYAARIDFTAFLWNLFLAWIPLVAALPVYLLRRNFKSSWLIVLPCGVIWFLFFPNAPYIVTDLQHLFPRPPVPYWYDIIMTMSFALTGLFVGYLSLYLMQETVRNWWGRMLSWIFAFLMLALSAFGIYLGRFLRWNSWDALLDPIRTVTEAARIANPAENRHVAEFSITFFAFALVCYLIVYSFTHLHAWTERDAGEAEDPEKKPVAVARQLH